MPTSDERGLLDELITVRDWLRYAVTSMTRANLVYGHGTTNAVDEAAFLLLATLNLPIDNVDPWLDARLTTAEPGYRRRHFKAYRNTQARRLSDEHGIHPGPQVLRR